MTRYTVIPKNPACQSQVVEADGYEWGIEKVAFWRGIEVNIGYTKKVNPEGELVPMGHQTVAEFAVDWVAGVVTAGALSRSTIAKVD